MYKRLLIIVTLISLAAASGFIVITLVEEVVDDFGVAIVSYGEDATLGIDDPSVKHATVTAFAPDPDGNLRHLGNKSGPARIPIGDWVQNLTSMWPNAPDELGVGILVVIEAERTGARHCTLVAAAPLQISLIREGKMPNVTLMPEYLECDSPGPWAVSDIKIVEASVPIAMVLSDSVVDEMRISLTTSSRPPYLGAGILVGNRYVGPIMAWFTRKHDVSVSASGSWSLTRGIALYARATVGYVALSSDSTELRIPVFLPDVGLEGNTWSLRPSPGLPEPGFATSILSPTESKGILAAGNSIWLQNAGLGKIRLGPVIELDPILGTQGLRSLLVGPLLNLRASGVHTENPRYFTTSVETNRGTIDVPSFIILT